MPGLLICTCCVFLFAVAMLDWMTGDPNSKYYVTQLLASTVGAAVEKALFASTVTVATGASGASTRSASAIANETVYVLPFQFTASAATTTRPSVVSQTCMNPQVAGPWV